MVTVRNLVNPFGRPKGLYRAVTVPFCPGSTGSFVHSETVQPQEVLTCCTTTGASPLLVKVKVWVTSPPVSLILPKSNSVWSNTGFPCWASAINPGRSRIPIKNSFLFIALLCLPLIR